MTNKATTALGMWRS